MRGGNTTRGAQFGWSLLLCCVICLTASVGRAAQAGLKDNQPDLSGTQAGRSSGRLTEKKAGTWNPFKSLYLVKLARAYRMSRETDRALEVLDRGLESFQAKADRKVLSVEKAGVLFGLARNLSERHRFREAVKRFEEAAAIDRRHRPERAIRAFKNIAAIYLKIGEVEAAREYHPMILELEKRKDENK